MIQVVLKDQPDLLAFQVSGHAGYDQPGQDIVCAGVSVLATSVLNGLDQVCDLGDALTYTYIPLEEPLIDVQIDTQFLDERGKRDARLLFDTLVINLKSLGDQYPDFIHITEEVST